MIQKVPPQSLEAEQSVLGALLIDGDCFRKIAGKLQIEDFYKAAHQAIFRAAEGLYRQTAAIDIVTVADELKKGGDFDKSGGLDYLITLANTTPTSANIGYYAEIVREKARAREILDTCMKAIGDVYAGQETKEVLTTLGRAVSNSAANLGGKLTPSLEVAREMVRYIEDRIANRGKLSGLPTGFEALDLVTDGLQGGDSIIIAARPGCGKTALGLTIGQNVAAHGDPVGFISVEMNLRALGLRMAASTSDVPIWKLRKGMCSDSFNKIAEGLGRISGMPITFAFKARNLTEIEAAAIEMCERHGAKLLILDYLQLVKVPKAESRRQEVGEISRFMKHLANTYEIPVISLAQLNREVEKRQDKKPNLADLKESGDIEQDADLVLFLWNTDEERKQSTCLLNVDLAKGRNYGVGEFKLRWEKETMRFQNVSARGG